jgi:hypothetical protein
MHHRPLPALALSIALALGGCTGRSSVAQTTPPAVGTLAANPPTNAPVAVEEGVRMRLYDYVVRGLSNRLDGASRTHLFPLSPQSFHAIGDGYWTGFTNWVHDPNSVWHGMRGVDSILVWKPRFHETAVTNGGTGILISPRHVLHAHHAGMNGFYKGITVHFVGKNGSMETAREIDFINLTPDIQGGTNNDCQIGLLDRDLTNVTPARVVPPDAARYWTNGLPVLVRSQSNYLWVAESAMQVGWLFFRQSSQWPALSQTSAIGGDSGGGIFLPFGDELLACANISHGSGANWNTAAQHEAINDAMRTLSERNKAPVYQLDPVSFSGFSP